MANRPNEGVCVAGAPKRPRRTLALVAFGAISAASILLMTERISAERRPKHSSPPSRDPGLAVAHARLRAEVRFSSYVFDGPHLPEPALRRPSMLEEKLGDCEVTATYFDRSWRRVETAEAPGPYAAIVEIRPKRGRPSRRYVRLYRLACPLPPDDHFDPDEPDELAAKAGISAEAVARLAGYLVDRMKGQRYGDLVRDPSFARALSGLSMTRDDGPARPWNDAEAAERRWWAAWKRAETLPDRRPRPFLGPKRIPGPPSVVLREGTLEEAGMKPGSAEAIDAVLRAWAADSDQAFAVCLARKGVIYLHRAYGLRDGEPMTVATKSRMASVTKPMSASLMMMLVDDGRLALDDRVADLLPPLHKMTSTRPITIRHLYTHTHGLEFWLKPHDEQPDFEERVADCYAFAQAGRSWSYNGTGYVLAGKAIEALSGESLPDFYREHLLGPLGMDDTDVTGTYGDAWSIPLDIARFGQMLLNGGAYGDKRFFRATTFHAMLPRPLTGVLGPDTKKVWGIGLNGTPREFGHGAASSATFKIDMEDQTVIVMTRNAAGKNFREYHDRFLAAIEAGIAR